MPLFRELRAFFLAALMLHGTGAWALEESKPLHWSADKEVWDRKTNRVELFGHATVRQPDETLSADYITVDRNTRTLDAKGTCVYITYDTVIYGEEMHFNMDTRTGSIIGGRVANDRFTLSGERINKLGEGRFQTHWGNYSTCRDCPRDWSFEAEDVDMQVEGYAYMHNVTPKIRDASALWLPYLIVPMKTRRQSGLLFPTLGASGSNGFTFVLPFFWAINRSSDMTFGVGEFGARGRRLEWEGRYALSPRSGGKANIYYLTDKTFPEQPNRWAADIAQSQEIVPGFEEKVRLTETSDNLYPIFIGDVPGRYEPVLASDAILSYGSPGLSAYLAALRYRNLLNINTNPDPTTQAQLQEVQFDPNTVQVFPTAVVTTNDRPFLGLPIMTGFTFGLTNFSRSGLDFDYGNTQVPYGTPVPTPAPAPILGVDPIRKAARFSAVPSVYTTLRPFDEFELVPSLKYYYYAYNFPQNQATVPPLYRGYLLFQTDLSTQLERIYTHDDPNLPRTKHLIRPMLTYSYIPPEFVRNDPSHPFVEQINYAQKNGLSGYNFDNYDLVPIDASPSNINYYVPLGNSLAYGFTTQLIRRKGVDGLEEKGGIPIYQRSVELTTGQAINFREYQKAADPVTGEKNPQPLTRLFTNLNFDYDHYQSGTTYTYTPYISGPRNTLSTSHTYIFERALHQRILTFDRSLVVSYSYNKLNCDTYDCGTSSVGATLNFSLSDYILPSYSTTFDLNSHRFLNRALAVQFQSPSQCWKFTFSLARSVDLGLTFGVDMALNLTGTGFGGVGEVAGQAMTH